ncbi:MAG: DUF2796 domain-containing protein [Pseudomonadota bacterium]
MRFQVALSCAAAAAAWISAAQAEPHVHGQAALTLSTDGSTVVATFTVDQHTAYGFEGEARNDAQAARANEVVQSLLGPQSLFSLQFGSQCALTDVAMGQEEAMSLAGLGGDDDHHDHDEHDDHDHDDHGHHDDHDHHDHHGHDEHHKENHADLHGDVTVRRVYTCISEPNIRTLRITAFDQFAGLERVDVTVLTAKLQTQKTITPQNTEWRLK